MANPRVVLWPALLALVAGMRSGRADPITFLVQPPLADRQLLVAERASFAVAHDGPAPEYADDETLSLTTMASVAIHDRVTATAMFGHLWRSAELAAPAGGRIERSSSGFGDVTLIVTATAYAAGLGTGKLMVAPLAGIKLPTGADDDVDALGPLPQRFQVGTGAVDGLGGAIAGWTNRRWELAAAVTYLARTAANDFEAGDELRVEVAAHRCVAPWRGCDRARQTLHAAFEGRFTHQAADRGRLAPAESGGDRSYAAPGLRWRHGRHTLEAAIELPLLQPLDRHIDFVARAGYRLLVD